MASLDADAIALADASCRILVVAPTVEQATHFIHRLDDYAFSRSPSGTPREPLPEPIQSPDTPGLHKIPWTISNRYYTAKIHFAIHTMHGLSPHLVRNVPAVIFTWAKGESYRHHVLRLSEDMNGYDLEVTLAVRTEDDALTISDPEEQTGTVEDAAEIDGFLSQHGFEFVDARGDYPPQRQHGKKDHHQDDGGSYDDEEAPHIPRVLDALSTIMWPSMKTRTSDRAGSIRAGSAREQQLLDWAQGSEDHSLAAVEEVVSASRESLATRSRGLQKEMEELERWLQEEGPSPAQKEDPWKSAATTGHIISSPTSEGFDTDAGSNDAAGKRITLKFEDDFTVFVSAPPVQDQQASRSSTPTPPSPSGLQSHIAGSLYDTLGSASDLGDTSEHKVTKHKGDGGEGSDDELPTKEEIREATLRIFGTVAAPSEEVPAVQASTSFASAPKNAATPSIVSRFDEASFSETFSFDDADGSFDNDESGEYEMAPFDLNRVLGVLQEMKTEIAAIEDEDERRKAAAKVALGLVYGLEAESHGGRDRSHERQ